MRVSPLRAFLTSANQEIYYHKLAEQCSGGG